MLILSIHLLIFLFILNGFYLIFKITMSFNGYSFFYLIVIFLFPFFTILQTVFYMFFLSNLYF